MDPACAVCPWNSRISRDGVALIKTSKDGAPARIELAAPRLGGLPNEATWGSGTPLPLILLAFCQTQTTGNRLQPLPIVSHLSAD